MNVDALSGRELDFAVEKYIYGADFPEAHSTSYGNDWILQGDGTWASDVPLFEHDSGKIHVWHEVTWPPEYHNSDHLAFIVVDYIMEAHKSSFHLAVPYFDIMTHSEREGWKAIFSCRDADLAVADAPTRPVAVLRAAIKYVLANPGLLERNS